MEARHKTAFIMTLMAAATAAPAIEEIWYEDIDHGLAGVERQVAQITTGFAELA